MRMTLKVHLPPNPLKIPREMLEHTFCLENR